MKAFKEIEEKNYTFCKGILIHLIHFKNEKVLDKVKVFRYKMSVMWIGLLLILAQVPTIVVAKTNSIFLIPPTNLRAKGIEFLISAPNTLDHHHILCFSTIRWAN